MNETSLSDNMDTAKAEAPELRANIVGMHFRPPAKAVVAELPVGAKLLLKREPDNPYDENAVQVWLLGFGPEADHCEHHELYQRLYDTGNWGQECFTNPLMLGFIDSSKTGMAKIFSEQILAIEADAVAATFTRTPAGTPACFTQLEPIEIDNGDGDPEGDGSEEQDEEDDDSERARDHLTTDFPGDKD